MPHDPHNASDEERRYDELGELLGQQHRDAFLGPYAADYEAWLRQPPPEMTSVERIMAGLAHARAWNRCCGVG
jgi:hypothetical protein